MAKKKKAVGYICDVPIPGTGIVISREDQRIRILKCAYQNGLELVTIYEDDDYTEDFMRRPGVRKVLEAGGKFDVLLLERVWCLTRNVKDLEPFLDKIDGMDAEVICTSCLWDFTSQKVRRRYMEDLGRRCRKEAKARAAANRSKRAA